MSHAISPETVDGLSSLIGAGTERLLSNVENGSDETLAATATELWEVVDALEDLLGTVDFDRLPDAVDASALPELVDVEGVPDAIREGDPDRALDLHTIRRAIELRELWNSVDLVGFRNGARRLADELDDVVDLGALPSGGDSEAAAELKKFVEEEKSEATNAAIQQEAKKAAKTARTGVVRGHAKFEALYESTPRGDGYAGRKPVSKNPTAVSTVPHGPLPASASTRVSTVPANVRGAPVDALPRIYGRRWAAARRR